jgi:hypothetical protein
MLVKWWFFPGTMPGVNRFISVSTGSDGKSREPELQQRVWYGVSRLYSLLKITPEPPAEEELKPFRPRR